MTSWTKTEETNWSVNREISCEQYLALKFQRNKSVSHQWNNLFWITSCISSLSLRAHKHFNSPFHIFSDLLVPYVSVNYLPTYLWGIYHYICTGYFPTYLWGMCQYIFEALANIFWGICQYIREVFANIFVRYLFVYFWGIGQHIYGVLANIFVGPLLQRSLWGSSSLREAFSRRSAWLADS